MAYTFDGPNKIITLTAGTTFMSVRDVWSRWVDWLLTNDNSKYLPAFEQVGGNDIDLTAGTSIPIYAFLKNGWRLKPQEASHTLSVNDGILLVSGGGDPFINTLGSFIVRINYSQPVQAITVATGGGGGGGGLTIEQAEQLTRVDTNITTNLDKKVSEVGGGGGYVRNVGLDIQDKNYIKETHEKVLKLQNTNISNIEEKLSEIDSHIELAKSDTINRIETVETEVCSDIIRKTKEIKEDNIKTRNLVRQKTKNLAEIAQKQLDSDAKDTEMIESIAQEFQQQENEEKEIHDEFEKQEMDEIVAEFEKQEKEIKQP